MNFLLDFGSSIFEFQPDLFAKTLANNELTDNFFQSLLMIIKAFSAFMGSVGLMILSSLTKNPVAMGIISKGLVGPVAVSLVFVGLLATGFIVVVFCVLSPLQNRPQLSLGVDCH